VKSLKHDIAVLTPELNGVTMVLRLVLLQRE